MNNLKELREQLGLQQKEFCEPLGIKQINKRKKKKASKPLKIAVCWLF